MRWLLRPGRVIAGSLEDSLAEYQATRHKNANDCQTTHVHVLEERWQAVALRAPATPVQCCCYHCGVHFQRSQTAEEIAAYASIPAHVKEQLQEYEDAGMQHILNQIGRATLHARRACRTTEITRLAQNGRSAMPLGTVAQQLYAANVG